MPLKKLFKISAILLVSLLLLSSCKKVEEPVKEKTYSYKQNNKQLVLLVGCDDYEKTAEDTYINDELADFIVLLILDNDNKTAQLLPINRDTMCYYDVFGADKTVVRQDYGQICISHCYGSGGIDSLINTKNAVSAVLDYINIDYYISITMAAIDIINDDVGGVEVYIEDDLTALDPSFVQGSTVKLTGHLCEKFVRARSSVTDGTNLMRMSRQKTYMEGFLKRLKELSYDEDIITKIYADTADYVTSNCTIYDMSSILDKLLTYEFLPELSLAGENVEGEEHYEFYLDEDKKVELVQSTFFDLVEDEN